MGIYDHAGNVFLTILIWLKTYTPMQKSKRFLYLRLALSQFAKFRTRIENVRSMVELRPHARAIASNTSFFIESFLF